MRFKETLLKYFIFSRWFCPNILLFFYVFENIQSSSKTFPQLISSQRGSEPLHFWTEYHIDARNIIKIVMIDMRTIIKIDIIIIVIIIIINETLSVPHIRVPFPTIMKPYLHSYETYK